MAKNLILWLVIAIILMTVFQQFGPSTTVYQKPSYSQFLEQVKSGRVKKVTIDGRVIKGEFATGQVFVTYTPLGDEKGMIKDLLDNNVETLACSSGNR